MPPRLYCERRGRQEGKRIESWDSVLEIPVFKSKLSDTGCVILANHWIFPNQAKGPPFWNCFLSILFYPKPTIQYITALPQTQSFSILCFPRPQALSLGSSVIWLVLHPSVSPILAVPTIPDTSIGTEASMSTFSPPAGFYLAPFQVLGGPRSAYLRRLWLTSQASFQSCLPLPTTPSSIAWHQAQPLNILTQVSSIWLRPINMIIQETTAISKEKYWRLVFQKDAKECIFSRPPAWFDQIGFILLISFSIWACLKQTLQEVWFLPKIMLLWGLEAFG